MENRQSIRFRLLCPFVAGIVVLALTLPMYVYWTGRKSALDSIGIMAHTKVDQIISTMTFLFRLQLGRAQNLVLEPRVVDLFKTRRPHEEEVAAAAEYLRSLVNSGDYYRDICVLDRTGECIASSNPSFLGRMMGGSAVVERTLSGEIVIDEFAIGKVTGKLSATVAGPIDADDHVVGAVLIFCEFPKLVNHLDGEIIAISLLAENGEFISHRDSELNKTVMASSKTSFKDLYAELMSNDNTGRVVTYRLPNQTQKGFAQIEPLSKWLVIASGDLREILAPVYRVTISVFIIGGVIFAIILAMVMYFMRGVIDTLLNLIRYAELVARGNINIKSLSNASLSRNDELGVLAKALTSMVRTIRRMLDKAREASRMKSDFLANMSHEIRTPINAVIGMAVLALRDEDMPVKGREYLEKIQLAARSQLGVLNDILDISKIEAGKLELENRPFRFDQLIQNAISIHQINAANKGVELLTQIDDDVPAALVGDQLRLGQVLNNLLSNAIKFTAKGQVRLICRVIDENPEGVLLEFAVADQGVGISKDAVGKLFRPFSQADTSISRKFGGTGLGLAISLNLVGMMPEGKISVTSKLGEGTTFMVKVRLPVDYDPDFGSTGFQPTEEDFAKLNLSDKIILIAEDNLINQEILKELISPCGVKTVIANNGKEALDLVNSEHFDLVFMDMQMPVMGGLEATTEIRKNLDLTNLPIVAVSANAMKEHRESGLAAGMNDYITKPVEISELYEMLTKWLVKSQKHIRQRRKEK